MTAVSRMLSTTMQERGSLKKQADLHVYACTFFISPHIAQAGFFLFPLQPFEAVNGNLKKILCHRSPSRGWSEMRAMREGPSKETLWVSFAGDLLWAGGYHSAFAVWFQPDIGFQGAAQKCQPMSGSIHRQNVQRTIAWASQDFGHHKEGNSV